MRTNLARKLRAEVLESRTMLTHGLEAPFINPDAPTLNSDLAPCVAQLGDANTDGLFDPSDIVHVLQAGKYLTGQPATWGEGDWNGDNVFDQHDVIAALQLGDYLAQSDRVTVDCAPIQQFQAAGDVGGGVLEAGTSFAPGDGDYSILRRGMDSVSFTQHTTGLPPGAYTVWFIAFNNPAGCVDGCDADDLFTPEPNASIFYATGGVVEEDGVGDFHGRIAEGEVPDGPGQLVVGPDGLVDTQNAEIHFIFKYHGPASEDPAVLYDQIHTLVGSCGEGANAIDYGEENGGVHCFDPQSGGPHFA